MLTKNESICQPLVGSENTDTEIGGFSTFSVVISPNNRVKLSLCPVREYHRQGKPRQSWVEPDFMDINDEGGSAPLASSPNCKKQKSIPELPNKKTFSKLARQRILDAAAALEKSGYTPNQFYFFTGTLPGSSDLACEYFARYSRKILNPLKQYLRDNGLYLTFNCWEWQLRKRAGMIPALHLHMVIVCQDEEMGRQLPDQLKQEWFRLLELYSKKPGVNLFERHDNLGGGQWTRKQLDELEKKDTKKPLKVCKTIRCEKSPAAYLSKYVGKGCLASDKGFQKRMERKGKLFYPSSWWSISNELRELISQHTSSFSIRLPIQKASQAFVDVSEFLSNCSTIKLNPISPDGYPEYLYQVLYVDSELYQDIKEKLIPAIMKAYGTVSTGYAKLPKIKDVALKWLQLDKNHRLYDKFMATLPFYYQGSGVDMAADYIRERAAKWVSSLCKASYQGGFVV